MSCATIYPPTSSNAPRATATPIYTLFQACGTGTGCSAFGITSISVRVDTSAGTFNATSPAISFNAADRTIKISFMVDFGTNTVTSADVSVLVGSDRIARFSISGISATRVSLFEVTFRYLSA